ncbi:hypothetical protein O6H91_13G102500 [Diphasiastrum complanatum]|uniref:Uncharacterized protein n=2 Tax=Diphasiastrum complanatum TaxID=34168 RepID=A0ACC2BXX1_DIPCM|nr:hypothetical protein O6H91_13G102500 [Diphasiastrum complanatum]KAJ7534611.1 hypothetical protein O6H91_13G102500 [Diphasiastrum complanatum]
MCNIVEERSAAVVGSRVMMDIRHRAFLLLAFMIGHASVQPVVGVENAVTEWNAVTQKIVRLLGVPNQIAARTYALVHISQYKALQAAYKANLSYPEAAAAYAGHYVLSELFPTQQSPIFDGFIAKQVLPLKLSVKEDALICEVAYAYPKSLLKQRVFDGSQKWAKFVPARQNGPTGLYQFTPNQTFALYPQLGETKTFVIKSVEDYDVFGGPPEIPSKEYDHNYNTIREVGDASSQSQTVQEKDTALFWEDGANTSALSGHLFNVSLAIVGSELSLKQTAKLFATYAIAGYDAQIAIWHQKYKYLFWRPITAVRQGDANHKPYPGYTPVLKTPPHPEYPSGHATIAGAYASVVSRFLGKAVSDKAPHGPFQVETESYDLPPRTYETIDGPATDVQKSRVYGGVHFPKSCEDGYKIGVKVGNFVWDHFEEIFGKL